MYGIDGWIVFLHSVITVGCTDFSVFRRSKRDLILLVCTPSTLDGRPVI